MHITGDLPQGDPTKDRKSRLPVHPGRDSVTDSGEKVPAREDPQSGIPVTAATARNRQHTEDVCS